MEMLRTTNIPSSYKRSETAVSHLRELNSLYIRKKIGSEDTGLQRFDLRRTLLDNSLVGTVFDQRHCVENITVRKKNDIYVNS